MWNHKFLFGAQNGINTSLSYAAGIELLPLRPGGVFRGRILLHEGTIEKYLEKPYHRGLPSGSGRAGKGGFHDFEKGL